MTGNKILDAILIAAIAVVLFKVTKAVLNLVSAITPGQAGEDERETAVTAAENPQIMKAVKFFSPPYGFSQVAKKYQPITVYYKKVGFSANTAQKIAKGIYEAHGTLNDDEQTVYTLLNQIPSLACLSLVAQRFNVTYPENRVTGWLWATPVIAAIANVFNSKTEGGLLNYLASFLDGKEMETVYKIISKKPVL